MMSQLVFRLQSDVTRTPSENIPACTVRPRECVCDENIGAALVFLNLTALVARYLFISVISPELDAEKEDWERG